MIILLLKRWMKVNLAQTEIQTDVVSIGGRRGCGRSGEFSGVLWSGRICPAVYDNAADHYKTPGSIIKLPGVL